MDGNSYNMTLRFLSFGPKHFRNGTTFLGRTACGLIGEQNYDNIRVYRRTLYAEWWYSKQTFLHWVFVNKSDWSNFFAILPKTDSSHGFPWKETQSRYAQFAEDTTNSDGYVNWYTYIWVGLASIWGVYDYIVPRRYFNSFDFLSEANKERLSFIDGCSSAGWDSSITYFWGFWRFILAPHEFHRFREERFTNFPPDSRLQSICVNLNRRNSFYDHQWRGVGYEKEMS